jgi:hypothetical protein
MLVCERIAPKASKLNTHREDLTLVVFLGSHAACYLDTATHRYSLQCCQLSSREPLAAERIKIEDPLSSGKTSNCELI